jgi:proline iminopeptidase
MFKNRWLKPFLLCFILLAAAELRGSNPPEELLIQVEDAKFFCRTIGSGSPVIVLHGGPGMSQDYLLPYMYRLAENHRVIFYDQRGCGQSIAEITPETVHREIFVKDIDSIRKAFDDEKVSILGHSWGCLLAMEYAIAYPNNVDKLILSNPIPASSEDFMLFVQEWMRRMAPFEGEMQEIHHLPGFYEGDSDIIERMHRIIYSIYFYDPAKTEHLNLRMTPTAALNGAKVYEYAGATLMSTPFNLYGDLQRLTMPTLIIQGDADVVPSTAVQHIHESIPGSQYVLIERCGHFPYVEEPELYFNLLNEFLR